MDNADVLKRWFDEVWGPSRSESVIDELMADDAQIYGVRSDGPIDRPAFKEIWKLYTSAFPGITVRLVDSMSLGNRVAFRALVEGNYEGTAFTFEGNGIVTVRDGVLVGSHETWNFLGLLTQLGAVREDTLEALLIKCAGGA